MNWIPSISTGDTPVPPSRPPAYCHSTDGGDFPINPHVDINRRDLEIRGRWGSDFSQLCRMIGTLEQLGDVTRAAFDGLITHEFGLGQMNDALTAVERGEAVKALIDPRKVNVTCRHGERPRDGTVTVPDSRST